MAETHDKRTETHACDLISRQAAIDALWHSIEDECGELQSYAEAVISDAEDAIKALPPAQPGWIPVTEPQKGGRGPDEH